MLESLLNTEGAKGVELYRQSFIDNDRVATGKTNKSVVYEVVKDDTSITLSIYGRKDINDLEDGVSADEYTSNPATFSDLEQWMNARGIYNRTPMSIDRGLKLSGWSTEGDNRTGNNGGTKDIITTPSQQILKSIQDQVTAASKDYVAKQIVITV